MRMRVTRRASDPIKLSTETVSAEAAVSAMVYTEPHDNGCNLEQFQFRGLVTPASVCQYNV